MATELLLHAKKEDYLTLIDQLDSKISQLKDTLSDYRFLKSKVSNFVEDSDSNFNNMQNNVETNIMAVQKAIALASNAKANLQKTVDQMDSMSSDVQNLMNEATETAANAIRNAIRIEGLGL